MDETGDVVTCQSPFRGGNKRNYSFRLSPSFWRRAANGLLTMPPRRWLYQIFRSLADLGVVFVTFLQVTQAWPVYAARVVGFRGFYLSPLPRFGAERPSPLLLLLIRLNSHPLQIIVLHHVCPNWSRNSRTYGRGKKHV